MGTFENKELHKFMASSSVCARVPPFYREPLTMPTPGKVFFLPTARFLPLASGNGSNHGYRGIPLNIARIQISNQNR
jgi:hypothetical protein